MSYQVKEIFYTLQGEGIHAGRPAVFCRFSGCNLWSGREQDRATAQCRFCDTDFRGTDGNAGGSYATAGDLARQIVSLWPQSAGEGAMPFVVCTGGEPLLQLDAALIAALHEHHCTIAIETNGTLPAPPGLDWICVSPKADAELVLRAGDELKLIYPQVGAQPERYAALPFRHHLLQPLDDARQAQNTALALAYCQAHPQWRLSLQMHKLVGIP